MCKVGLWRLGVIKTSMTNGATRSPEGEIAAVKVVARTVPVFGRFVDDLKKFLEGLEVWGDFGEFREVWGGLGRFGEVWGGLGIMRGFEYFL